MDQVFETGEAFRGRDMPVALSQSGGQRYIDLLYEPVRDEAGQVTSIFVGGYDVTVRVRAEQRRKALIDLEERLRDVADPADLSYAASRLLGEALNVERVGYGIIDGSEGTITVERNWSAPGFADVAGVHHMRDYGSHVDELIAGHVVANADVTKDPRSANKAAAFQAFGIAAHLEVPVTENGVSVANVFVNSARPREWTEEEIAFVGEFASRMHAVITRRRAEQSLRESNARVDTALAVAKLGTFDWHLQSDVAHLIGAAAKSSDFPKAFRLLPRPSSR